VIKAQEVVSATGHSYVPKGFVWEDDLSAAVVTVNCSCGDAGAVTCSMNWENTVSGKLTVTASAVVGDQTISDSKEISATVNGETVTVILPNEIPGLRIIAATYQGKQMTGCEVFENVGSMVTFVLTGDEIRLYFLTDGYRPLMPVLVI